MPLISIGKLRAAKKIGSAALRAEAKETLACSYLSLTLLIGLVANAAAGWWWADPLAALLMVPWLLKEGVEGLRGERTTVLFLCTGNSCRSQMAEGWARTLHGGRIEARSAGIEPKGLDPRAVKVMAEVGVDISGQRSKHLDELADEDLDLVITVCDNAKERCPVLPGQTRRLHVGFDDPPALAAGAKSDEQGLEHYRRVRDEIRRLVRRLPDTLRHGKVDP
jgi:arsenate reductase